MATGQHVKLTALGEFRNSGGTVLDIWQASVSLAPNGGGVVGVNAPYAQADQLALAAAGYTFWHAVLSAFACQAGVWLTGCKAAFIGLDGKYPEQFSDGADYLSSVEGSAFSNGPSAAPLYPSEVALAVTLRTIVGTGKKSGRFYMPFPGDALTDFELTAAQTNALAVQVSTAADTLHTSVATVPAYGTPGYTMAVPHKLGAAFAGTRNVVEIAVGGVPDVQRRRRNKMLESYSAHAI